MDCEEAGTGVLGPRQVGGLFGVEWGLLRWVVNTPAEQGRRTTSDHPELSPIPAPGPFLRCRKDEFTHGQELGLGALEGDFTTLDRLSLKI